MKNFESGSSQFFWGVKPNLQLPCKRNMKFLFFSLKKLAKNEIFDV